MKTQRNLIICLCAFSICLVSAGYVFVRYVKGTGCGEAGRSGKNFFLFIFANYEGEHLLLVIAGILLFLFYLIRFSKEDHPQKTTSLPCGIEPVIALAGLTLVVTALGSITVYHNFPLSMDEFLPGFQANIFLDGKTKAVVPDQWRSYASSITPIFVDYDAQDHTWVSTYLPVYALMAVPFVAANATFLLNALLAAIALLIMYRVALLVFRFDRKIAVLAVILLFTSQQFIVTSMSFYSYPAHLAFNLVFLWALLEERVRLWWFLPIIGFAAMGLHQPVMHVLFAAPFFLIFIKKKQWGPLVTVGLSYVCSFCFWMIIWKSLRSSGVGGLKNLFGIPGYPELLMQAMNACLTVSWQPGVLLLLVLVGFYYIRKAPMPVVLSALACISTFVFYFFFLRSMGHGWGYRYFYPTLPCLIIICVWGYQLVEESFGRAAVSRALVYSLLLSVFVQWPLRAAQVDEVVGPFARGYEALQEKEGIVLVDPRAWYSDDFIRTDPLFRTDPKVLNWMTLESDQYDLLRAHYKVSRIKAEDFSGTGMYFRTTSGRYERVK